MPAGMAWTRLSVACRDCRRSKRCFDDLTCTRATFECDPIAAGVSKVAAVEKLSNTQGFEMTRAGQGHSKGDGRCDQQSAEVADGDPVGVNLCRSDTPVNMMDRLS